jgi:hypothetical protein
MLATRNGEPARQALLGPYDCRTINVITSGFQCLLGHIAASLVLPQIAVNYPVAAPCARCTGVIGDKLAPAQ